MKSQRISYFISKKNVIKNIHQFGKSTNILFITGLSGSGKSTLSKSYAEKYNAIVLELDCLGGYSHFKYENSIIKDITKAFLSENPEIKNAIQNKKYMDLKLNHFQDYIDYNNKYLQYIVNYCQNHIHQNFIIEGTQLFMTIIPAYFIVQPIIIIKTSSVKSLLRRLNRQLNIEEKLFPFTKGRNHILKLLNDSKRLHYKDVKKLNEFLTFLDKNS